MGRTSTHAQRTETVGSTSTTPQLAERRSLRNSMMMEDISHLLMIETASDQSK